MTSFMNQVICSSAKYYVSALHRCWSPNTRLLACKFSTVWKWEDRNMNYCTPGNTNYRSLLQPLVKNLQLSQSFALPVSLMCRTLTKRTSPKLEEKLRINDRVPIGYELIYKAPMDLYMSIAQGVSTVSLLLLFVGSIYKTFVGNVELVSIPTTVGDMIENHEQLLLLGMSLLLASLGIRNLASNYPVRIYHCDGSYISIFTPQLPVQMKTLEFKKGDVTHLKPTGILPWRDSKYTICKKKVILLEDFFRAPADLAKMMEAITT